MKNLYKYLSFIRNATIITFGITSISMYKDSLGMILLLGGISVFLIVNDYVRDYRLYNDEKKSAISTFASMIICGVALIFDRGYMSYYFFAILNDAFYLSKKWTRFLVYSHACFFKVITMV